jgi:lysophospholipase L1-like esterase
MKKTILITLSTLALLAAPAFAGNDKNYTYLALGDSVPFGLNVLLLPPYSTTLPTPDQFIGYPEIVASLQTVMELNASCPGETSGSFLNVNSPDYGCNSPHVQPPLPVIPPFKTSIGLKADYKSSQIAFAESQLASHKNINEVTLSIGANDVLLALPQIELCGTDTVCAQKILGPILENYAQNLTVILTRLRKHYQGKLVLLKYYSPAPPLDGIALAVNGTMMQVATQMASDPRFTPVVFADGFAAFQAASAKFGGDACLAGLLIQLPSPPAPPCDIHPSPTGRDLLAAIVALALQ